MPRSSARSGQTELAALVAVLAVCLGLSLYAGVLDAALPDATGSSPARTAADRVADLARVGGVVRPGRLDRGLSAAPVGHRLNATLRAADRTWHVGPPVPSRATTATRRVSVRVAPGRVRPGQLRVAVWR